VSYSLTGTSARRKLHVVILVLAEFAFQSLPSLLSQRMFSSYYVTQQIIRRVSTSLDKSYSHPQYLKKLAFVTTLLRRNLGTDWMSVSMYCTRIFHILPKIAFEIHPLEEV
jgi:hypothetical protein